MTYRTKQTRKRFSEKRVDNYLSALAANARAKKAIRLAMVDGCTYAEAGRRADNVTKQYVYKLVKRATRELEK